MFAHGLEPTAEVDALRADGRSEQLGERRRERGAGVERAQEVLVGCRMQAAEQREDLVPDQAPLRVGVRGVEVEVEPGRAAIRLRLLPPQR